MIIRFGMYFTRESWDWLPYYHESCGVYSVGWLLFDLEWYWT